MQGTIREQSAPHFAVCGSWPPRGPGSEQAARGRQMACVARTMLRMKLS
jgi:hypothetical protein